MGRSLLSSKHKTFEQKGVVDPWHETLYTVETCILAFRITNAINSLYLYFPDLKQEKGSMVN